MKRAIADYDAKRYDQAHSEAVAVCERAPSGQREEAAYLAGLSAYQLGNTTAADRYLLIASTSTSPETAARAKAMLGQVRLDQHRPSEAASLLVEAADELEGDDAAKAAFSASVAYQRVGDDDSARKWAARANAGSAAVTQSTPPSAGNGAMVLGAPRASGQMASSSSVNASTGFSLQVGAFREKSRAKQAADDAQKLASRDGLGEVRIIPRRDERGKAMYVVQFGAFPTREAAAAARAKLGRLEYIVAPMNGRVL